MLGNSLVIGLGLWVVFQARQGYRKGFWRAFISLLALAIAYLVAVLCTPSLMAWLGDKELPAYAPFAAYPILFFTSYILVTSLPFMVFKQLDAKSPFQQWGGASIGASSGLVSGLIFIWFVGFLITAIAVTRSKVTAGEQVDASSSNTVQIRRQPIQNLASHFVSKSTQFGLRAIGSEPAQVESVDLLIRQPEVLMQGLQAVVKSDAMADIVRSSQTQRMMALNDVNSLLVTPSFARLMAVPEMQAMTQKLQTEGRSARESERFVAEQITYLWRRMQYVKHDPRVVELLKDQNLQAQLKTSNPVTLLSNPKFQRLVAIVVGDSPNMDGFDFTETIQVDKGRSSNDSHIEGPSNPVAPTRVYRWQDNEGVTRYNAWGDIPEAQRARASMVVP